jgi:hypothetical protein
MHYNRQKINANTIKFKRCYEILALLGPYCSSPYCWASVANALNVLQPYWLIVLPLDVPAVTTSLLPRDPSGQKWNYIYRPSYF